MNPSEHRSALGRSMFPLLASLSESIRIEAANLASLISGPSELRSHASIDFVRRLAESTSVASEQTIASQRSVELTASAPDAATTTSEAARVEFVVQCVQCYLRGVDLVDGALVAAAQLTQSSKLSAKRAGYLALRVFLAPPRAARDSELLVVASLQRDLMLRARPIEQCMALAAMDALQLDVNVAPAVVPLVRELLLRSANVTVRTRATVSLARLMARGVDIGDSGAVAALLAQLLADPSPSVLGAALVWLLELLEADAPCPIRSASLCEALVGILRQCIDFCLPADLNAGGVAAPFVQIKLLRCIGALCRRAAMGQDVGGVAQCRSAAPVLSALLGALQSLPSTTAAALLVEVAQTVAVLPNSGAELRRAVAETATPLLAAHSSAPHDGQQSAAFVGARRMHVNTARAAALAALRHVGADAFDKRLRQLVVECLETDDDTLQRLTLDLLSSVTNANNVTHIAQRMSICARDATTLAAKLGLLRQTVRLVVEHAPTPHWLAQTLASMMLAHCGAERRAHGGAWLRASPHTRAATRASACEYLADQLTACVYSRASNDVWNAVAEQLVAHHGPLCQRALELAALVAAHALDNDAIVERVFAEVSAHQSLTTGASDAVAALAAASKPRRAVPPSRLSSLLARANKWPAVASPRADDPRAVEWVVACGGTAEQSAPTLVRPRWQYRDDEQAAPQARQLHHSIATPSLSPRTPMTASRLKFAEPSPSMAAASMSMSSSNVRAATAATDDVHKPWSMAGWTREAAGQPAIASSQSSHSPQIAAAESQSSSSATTRDKLARELFGD